MVYRQTGSSYVPAFQKRTRCGWSNLISDSVSRSRARGGGTVERNKDWTGWRAWAAKEVRALWDNSQSLPDFAMTGREKTGPGRVGKEGLNDDGYCV